MLGLEVAGPLDGSILVEAVFSLPGVGRVLVDAVEGRDFPVLPFGLVAYPAVVVAANLVVDMAHVAAAPRVRLEDQVADLAPGHPGVLTLFAGGLAAIVAPGVLAPRIPPHDPNATDLLARSGPPARLEGGGRAHPSGIGAIGRDLPSRCLHGIRTSFGIAALGLVFGAVLGVALGLVSGPDGPRVDRVAMAVTDVFPALPNPLLLPCGIALPGTEIRVLVVVIGPIRWEAYARLVRGQVLALRGGGHVEAARALGAGPVRVALVHLLPHLASPLLVALTLSFSGVLLMEAGPSFLGVDVQPPTSSLGRMIGDGRDHLIDAWWISGDPLARRRGDHAAVPARGRRAARPDRPAVGWLGPS